MALTPGRPDLRVLVVDDHEDGALSTAFLLKTCGHAARFAFDGPSALAAAREDDPHVVLLDLSMPGMDGFAVASELLNASVGRPPLVVAITGLPGDEVRRKTTAAGFHMHLSKPVDPAALVALLERVREFVAEDR